MDWFLYDNGLRHERVNFIYEEVLRCTFTWAWNLVTVKSNEFDIAGIKAKDKI